MNSGELHLIIGPMWSGKTTALLQKLFNESVIGVKCIYINHLKDTRSNECFSTHNPLYKEKLSKESGVTLTSASRIKEVNVEEYQVIGIDESQFFDNLVEDVLDLVDKKKKIVYISGLNGDKDRNKIGDITELIPHMDSCTFLKGYCKLCAKSGIKKESLFSFRFTTSVCTTSVCTNTGSCTTNSVIDIGSDDKYMPLCRKCYLLQHM